METGNFSGEHFTKRCSNATMFGGATAGGPGGGSPPDGNECLRKAT